MILRALLVLVIGALATVPAARADLALAAKFATLLPPALPGHKMAPPNTQNVTSGAERGALAMGFYREPKSGLSLQIRILGTVTAEARAFVLNAAAQGARAAKIKDQPAAISEDKGAGGITIIVADRYTVLVIWPPGIPAGDAMKYAEALDYAALAALR
jgi:hypothetical protein